MSAISRRSRYRAARDYVHEYAGAVIAAGLMFGGTFQVLSLLRDPIAIGIIRLINAVIRKAFRGVIPLPSWDWPPWLFWTRSAAVGIIVAVVGVLVGLWVNARSQPEAITEKKQSPRRGEGLM